MTDAGGRSMILLVAAVVLAAGMGLRDPWPPDEPRFALVAKDMVESGAWLIPRVAGIPYPDKPPLFFWMIAAFYVLTGSMRVAFLLPTFISGLAVLWLVHDLASRLWTPRTALLTALALLATLQFPLQMKSGQIDGVLTLWTTIGLYGLCRHLLLGPDWRWYGIAGFACGLGVITKGVGFLPFLILIPYAYALRRHWPMPAVDWGKGRWLRAPVLFALAVGLWLVPMLVVTISPANPDLLGYRDNILMKQTITRYADAWGHLKPPWYLVVHAVPLLWMPLTALMPWLIPAWTRDLRARSTTTLLLGGWVLLVLLFFSVSSGKRSVYIFPALPAFALLCGNHLDAILARASSRKILLATSLCLSSIVIACGFWLLGDPPAVRQWLDEAHKVTTIAWPMIGMGAVGLGIAAIFRIRSAPAGLATVTVTLWVAVSMLVYPKIDNARSGRFITSAAAGFVGPGEMLGFAGWKEQFLLHWKGPVVHFGYRRYNDVQEGRDAASWLAGDDGNRLLLPADMIAPCFDSQQLQRVGLAHRQVWYLAGPPSVVAACRTEADAAIFFSYGPARSEFKSAIQRPARVRSAARSSLSTE